MARFYEKVRALPVDDLDACWVWQGSLNSQGHSSFWFGHGELGGGHRFAYETLVGSVPPGMHLDHVCHSRDLTCSGGAPCRHRRCVNPDHLEPVSPKENTRRGRGHGSETHCPKGHPYDERNTGYDHKGRRCRACGRLYMATYSRHSRPTHVHLQGNGTAVCGSPGATKLTLDPNQVTCRGCRRCVAFAERKRNSDASTVSFPQEGPA